MRHPIQALFVFLLVLLFGPYLLALAALLFLLYVVAFVVAAGLRFIGATR